MIKNGLYKSYYESRQLSTECNYVNGIKNGIYKKYHNNGKLSYECNYINDKKEGLFITTQPGRHCLL